MEEWRKKLENELKLKGYSPQTIKTYSYHVKEFIESQKSPREFILSLIEKNKSNETIRSTTFALKFYLNLLNKEDNSLNQIIKNLPNSKKEKRLPEILSKEEIDQMIKVTTNLIHRTIIQMGYSSGLRVSEITNLKWPDIDLTRKTIHIKQSKGKKDRIIMLSEKVKCSLENLENDGGPLFKSNRGNKYSNKSIQKIVENAARKAKIQKRVTPHTLRHSFATHLLERGTDIRYIKDLLGHSNISTTLIYTKVSNRELSKIKSPLDE